MLDLDAWKKFKVYADLEKGQMKMLGEGHI